MHLQNHQKEVEGLSQLTDYKCVVFWVTSFRGAHYAARNNAMAFCPHTVDRKVKKSKFVYLLRLMEM